MAQAIPAVLTVAANANISNPYLLIFAYIAIAFISNSLIEEEAVESDAPTTMIRSGVQPKNIIYGTYETSGPIVYAGGLAGSLEAGLSLIVALAGHPVEDITGITLGDIKFSADKVYTNIGNSYSYKPHDNSYAEDTRIYFINGQDPDSLAAQDLKRAIGHKWAGPGFSVSDTPTDVSTSTNKLNDIPYVGVLLRSDGKNWTSIPNILARVKGKKVRDPVQMADDQIALLDPLLVVPSFSSNWAACVLDYLMDTVLGMSVPVEEIDLPSFKVASILSDEQLPLASGIGTFSRYTVDGILSTGDTPANNLEKLLSAASGTLTYTQGKYVLKGASYATPLVASDDILDDSDLLSPIKIQTGPATSERFSAIRGTYNKVLSIDNWAVDTKTRSVTPSDFPEVTNPLYSIADSGSDNYTDPNLNGLVYKNISLPMTSHPERAQYIAAVILNKARQGVVLECEVGFKALKYSVGDNIKVSFSTLGIGAETNPGYSPAIFGPPVVSGGAIISIPISSGGSGYNYPPSLTLDIGTDALILCTIEGGSVKEAIVVTGGTGYTVGTTITPTDPTTTTNFWLDKVFTVEDWKATPQGGIKLVLREDSVSSYNYTPVQVDDTPDIETSFFYDEYKPRNLRLKVNSLESSSPVADIEATWDPGTKPSSTAYYEAQLGKGSGIFTSISTLSSAAVVVDASQAGGYSALATFVTDTAVDVPESYALSSASNPLGIFNFAVNVNTATLPEYRDKKGNFQDFGEETIQ